MVLPDLRAVTGRLVSVKTNLHAYSTSCTDLLDTAKDVHSGKSTIAE